MKFDSLGFIEMEQEGFPGNIGDCCAETSRWATLMFLTGQAITTDFSPFVTSQGLVRYPSPPSPWAASDTSDDQTSPFIAASLQKQNTLCATVINQVVGAGYKTGNGQFVHPSSFAQIKRAQGSRATGLLDVTIFIQALIFLIPYRWSDSTNSLVSSAGSTADYLNFVNYLAFARLQKNFSFFCWAACKLTPLTTVMAAVTSYYQPEPNNQMILDLYAKALPIIYGG